MTLDPDPRPLPRTQEIRDMLAKRLEDDGCIGEDEQGCTRDDDDIPVTQWCVNCLAGAVLSQLADQEARIATLEAERDEAREAIAWANNSLYGSHGYFLSTTGGPSNPHHLDEPIERLKAQANRAVSRLARLEQALRDLIADYDQLLGDGVTESNQPAVRRAAVAALRPLEAASQSGQP